jgi:regulator of replication initiation timing
LYTKEWHHLVGMNKGSPELATKYWKKIGELEKQFGKVVRENNQLKERLEKAEGQIIELQIENAYLKEKLFGKSNKRDDDGSDDDSFTSLREVKPKKEARTAKSYRRPEPKDEEIEETKEYTVEGCDTCKGELTDLQILERFIEDIPAFFEIIGKLFKKELIHSGFCKNCNRRSYGKETNLQGQKVTLGPNVKLLVIYFINVLNMSFQNTVDLIFDLYRLKLSKGELRNMLYEASEKFEEEHFRIREQIRGKPAAHMDETGWRKLGQKWFGWIFAPADGEEVSFEITSSRGKGVAEKIVGKDYDGIIISDFYRLYKKFGSANQSCWVHLIRDFENLAKNKNIPKNQKKAHVSSLCSDL